VGHLNIGAGRIVYQDLTALRRQLTTGTFSTTPLFCAPLKIAVQQYRACTLMGLNRRAACIRQRRHYEAAALKLARDHNLEKVYFHCFLDGRDTPPPIRCRLCQKRSKLI
jgi:2,3-bisphosphoglycerate-independent phosphoglycerate mutase